MINIGRADTAIEAARLRRDYLKRLSRSGDTDNPSSEIPRDADGASLPGGSLEQQQPRATFAGGKLPQQQLQADTWWCAVRTLRAVRCLQGLHL